MADENDSTFEKFKGTAKEAFGKVTGDEETREEAEQQQKKAQKDQEAERAEREAEAKRQEAARHEDSQREK